jgi:hypothetical protein
LSPIGAFNFRAALRALLNEFYFVLKVSGTLLTHSAAGPRGTLLSAIPAIMAIVPFPLVTEKPPHNNFLSLLLSAAYIVERAQRKNPDSAKAVGIAVDSMGRKNFSSPAFRKR